MRTRASTARKPAARIIGAGTKIDNLVQIGHNCRIGKHCVLASLTGLAGSTVIGDYVKIAGQVGTRGHMTDRLARRRSPVNRACGATLPKDATFRAIRRANTARSCGERS